MRKVQDYVDASLRKEINFLLATFPVNQSALFECAYPDGIGDLKEQTLRAALALCFRTEAANEAKARVMSPAHRGDAT